MQYLHQILEDITQHLEHAGIAYMLSGSVALSYYAQPRMTRDIDLVLEIHNNDVSRFALELGDAYYLDEDMALDAIARESMFNLWIVSAEDLVLSKLDWLKDTRSEMQFKDIANLIASVPDLDWDYLQQWANQLGLTHLLEEIRP